MVRMMETLQLDYAEWQVTVTDQALEGNTGYAAPTELEAFACGLL